LAGYGGSASDGLDIGDMFEDVLVKEWPPELFQELHMDSVNLLVTQNIMYFFQQLIPLLLQHYNLVTSVCVLSP
jgi:hypothetical protein